MRRGLKKACIALFLILTVVGTAGLGCAGGGEEGKTTIVIGNLTDLTGVAAPALEPLTWALEDIVKDINEKQPIPGVKLEVINYDTAFNPARFLTGYDYLKGKGAEVIISVFNDASEVLKPYAAEDKIALLGMATSVPMVEPAGWVFAFSAPARWSMKALLKWVSDDWDYPAKGRKPTLATVGWNDAWGQDNARGAEEFCQANPTLFEYKGTFLSPVGYTGPWSGDIAKTRNVDYINVAANGALMPATFWKEYRDAGGTGTNIDTEAQSAYAGFITDYCGWDYLGGKLNSQCWGWWNLDWPEIQYIKNLLLENRPGDAQDLIKAGMGYLGGGAMQRFALDIVLAAIEEAGAENFDGQAFYNTAVTYMEDWAGSQRGFTATRRYAVDDCCVLEWSAADEDLKLISDIWVPLIY
jgi:hypothetical protein